MAARTLNLLSAILVGALTLLLARIALLEPNHMQTSKRLTADAPLQNVMAQRGNGFDRYQRALASAAARPNTTPNWLGHYVSGSGLASEGLTLGPQGEFAYYIQGCLGKSNQTLGQFSLVNGTISLVAQPFSAKFATTVVEQPPYESQYSSMAHDWQLRWWLDDAGQRTAPFLLPNKLENDFIAELRDGCFEPARLGHAVWRDVDASKRLQGKPALTPAQRKQVLRKTISARILAIEQSGGSDMHLTLDRGARDGVFVGEKFRFPFRVISVLENSAIVSGPTAIVDNSLKVGDSFVSSTPGTLVACPNEPDLSLDAAFPASRVH